MYFLRIGFWQLALIGLVILIIMVFARIMRDKR